ncbi:uncharacterized protein qrfp [Anguilla anguilla]|uniref:uncharacterized protein qrfp n=1 Tax=Anguilla anguilla TaxID=7936 RepID=UPI0015B26074|nr:uncharacterized protein qrfp [Anguilla anguilla]
MTPAAFHLGFSLRTLSLLSVALLAPLPGLTAPVRPSVEHPGWEDALLRLQALLGLPGTAWMPRDPSGVLQPNGQSDGLSLEHDEEEEEEDTKRARREDWLRKSVGQFPERPLETGPHMAVGEGEGAEKTKALTSIAGGLQAINRQKGGFGFRFGKK